MVWKIFVRISAFIGIISQVLSSDELYRCPEHLSRTIYLKTFQEKCYRFDKTELYWTSARDRCRGEGGDLIQIRNMETQSWVMGSLNELHWGTNGVWIGAHDRHSEMNWIWVTGERISWNNWASGQPSCGWFFCFEDCGTLRRDDHGRWHDKACDTVGFTYSFICQFDMKPRTTTTTTTTTTTLPTTTTTTLPTTTTTLPTTTTTTTTTTPPSTTTPTTTTTMTTSTTLLTTSTTTTATTTTTIEKTMKPSTTEKPLVIYNQTNIDAVISKEDHLSNGEMAGFVVAGILGALILIMLIGVCFFRTRKEGKQDSLSMHFDNLTYTVRSVVTGSRMSGQERHLNNQVSTGTNNMYADPNTCCPTQPSSDSCTSTKEPSHYSEISEQKLADKLNAFLPKYDNAEYEKCNVAKSKLFNNDKSSYIDACAYNKGVYDTVSDNEASCNAMNEQLENSLHQYDECGSLEKGDNPTYDLADDSKSPYVDLGEVADSSDSFDNVELQFDMGPSVYEEMVVTNGEATNLDDFGVSMDQTLDLSKTPAGYSNNLYGSNA